MGAIRWASLSPAMIEQMVDIIVTETGEQDRDFIRRVLPIAGLLSSALNAVTRYPQPPVGGAYRG